MNNDLKTQGLKVRADCNKALYELKILSWGIH